MRNTGHFRDFIQIAGIGDIAEANLLVECGIRYLGASIVQLHGDIGARELARLKRLRPHLTVVKSLVIGKPQQEQLVDTVRRLSAFVDAYITDTFDPVTEAVARGHA